MNLNDRVALILGRAVIRAEELAVRLDEAQAELAVLAEKQNENTAKSDSSVTHANREGSPLATKQSR